MNIGRYRVEQRLGEGPRGVVYRGHDADGPRGHLGPVVIKVLHAHVCRDPNLEKQCQDLVHTVRAVRHDAIVRPFGVGTLPDGRVYLVSEYVAGQTLHNRLRDGGALPTLTAMHVAKALASALAAAQKQGLCHLALKPSNVLLLGDPTVPGGERVKLLDLGLGGILPGTDASDPAALAYLSPEQLDGEGHGAGPQADVYSLGSIFYEMLTGRPRRAGDRSSLRSIPPAPPTPIQIVFPALFKEMTALLQLMRQQDPAQRPLMSQVAHRLAQLEEDMLIGETIGAYRVINRLAQGGMSTVFRAVNEQIGRQVAIKVMRSRFIGNGAVRKRFLNEARVANMVRHPGLVEIHEFGELPRERPFLVMELLEGESLRQRRERRGGSLPEAEALEMARQLAEVVLAVQGHGVYHLDLKPDNVMIVAGPGGKGERVKLLDFGTAQAPEQPPEPDLGGHTDVEVSMGTPSYMAPEQFGGASAVTDRTDVYALGVILYELLAGRRPYAQAGFAPLCEPHPRLREVQKGISPAVEVLVEGMLAYRPAERPRLGEVLERLGALARGEVVMPLDDGSRSAVTQPMRSEVVVRVSEEEPARPRAPAGALLAGAGLCALAFGLGRWTAPRRAGGGGEAMARLQRPPPTALPDLAAPRATEPAAPGPSGPGGPEAEPAPAPPGAEGPEASTAALHEAATAVLQAGLRQREAPGRRWAATLLGRVGQRGAPLRPTAEALLSDGDRRVVRQAARALGHLGDRAAAPALSSLLGRTRDPYSFVAAADALGRLGDAAGPKRLREALQSREGGVRLLAAVVLAEQGDETVAAQVRKDLAAPDLPPLVRMAALGYLARGGDGGAAELLARQGSRDGGDSEVRVAAALRLGQAGDERGRALLLSLLGRPGVERLQAAAALSELQDGDCARFHQQLADPMQPPLLVLAAGLGGCARAEDRAPLGGMLRGDDGAQRLAAAAALLRSAE